MRAHCLAGLLLLTAPVLSAQQPGSLAALDRVIEEAITARKLPGAVVLIGKGAQVLYR
jgi:hypothetical protein